MYLTLSEQINKPVIHLIIIDYYFRVDMVSESGKVVTSRNWDNIRYKDALESCRIYNNRYCF